MSKTLTPTTGTQPAMPLSIAQPTQSQAAQFYDLFENLSDLQGESLTGILSRFTKAVTKQSTEDVIYVQSFIAQVLHSLAPHGELFTSLSAHYYLVSLQDQKEVTPC